MDDIIAQSEASPLPLRWWQGTLAHALLGSLLLALSFPPADLWPLAWVATLPWLRLIALPHLPGKRPYAALYLAGFVHWLLVLHWLRLPHWTTASVGVLLCAYLAAYLPLFVGLSRVVVQRWRWSLPLTAALVWMGLEYLRQWFLTGFSMACLAHTQYRWLALIQAAEFGGATLVSGVVLFPAAWLASALWLPGITRQRLTFDGVIGGGIFAAALIYGFFELQQPLESVLRVALIQGSYDTTFAPDVDRITPVMEQYGGLTKALYFELNHIAEYELKRIPQPRPEYRKLAKAALANYKWNNSWAVDLLVWPESSYRYPMVSFSPNFIQPRDMKMTPQEFARACKQRFKDEFIAPESQRDKDWPIPPLSFLIGMERSHVHSSEQSDRYNSAAFFQTLPVSVHSYGESEIQFYDKCHLVPCGEFMPFADWFPWIYQLSPVGGGLQAGKEAKILEVLNFAHDRGTITRISPSICYENVMPQVIRQQILELHAKNETPDVLVNISNDGWFFGSSELDLHLVCGVFRAVETRRPMLIAANTGFSAAIDPLGRITAKGKRHEPDILIVDAEVLKNRDRNWLSSYVLYGELPGKLGLLLCAAVVALQIVAWRRRSRAEEQGSGGAGGTIQAGVKIDE